MFLAAIMGLFGVGLCYYVLSVSCSLMVTCWERVDFLDIQYVMVSCVLVTFPYGILGQMWYLIVSIPDLRLLPYFKETRSATLNIFRNFLFSF